MFIALRWILKVKSDEHSDIRSIRQGLLLSVIIERRALISRNFSLRVFLSEVSEWFSPMLQNLNWMVYQRGVKNYISQWKAEWCCLCQPTWRIRGSWSPYPCLPVIKWPVMALCGRLGHGSIYCHWFSWQMDYPVVWWNFTRTELQLVDFFTMVLSGERFRLILQNLGLESLMPVSL